MSAASPTLDMLRAWHAARPEIYAAFDHYTHELIRRGFTCYSAQAIFARIRWDMDQPNSSGGSTFAMPRDYFDQYAKKWMAENSEHAGFFAAPAAATAASEHSPEMLKHSSSCRSCGKKLFWMVTHNHRRIPIDFDSVDPSKEMVWLAGDPLYDKSAGHITHFTTCPNAEKHRQ